MAEKIGVDAVWNNQNFNKGQAEYMNKMLQSQGATGSTISSMNQMGASTGGLGGILGNLSSSLGISTAGFVALGATIGVAVGAFKLISGAVSSFVDFMFKGADSAIMVASRVEQLNLIAQTLAANQGMAGEAVNELVVALNKQGISMAVANMTVAQFSRMQLDLAKATELGRVAQDAATIANEGSSDALEGLLHGIQTLNIRVLRQHGILVETDLAYAKYAETINKTAASLTSAEKQQAMLNAVIENGAAVAGAYEASMLTAGKQLGSMSSRVLPDLKNALGAPFQGAFYNVVKGFNDMLDGFRKMTSEGGVLYPIMIQLGAAFQLLTEPIRAVGSALNDATGGPLQGFINKITGMVSSMAQWGANLIVNFATGIINAASTILVKAINFVANILASWFSPGSPPAILPEIDVWGAETMQEYLIGFTEADFSILDSIQGQMKNVFTSLADMGEITKEAGIGLWSSFSEQFIQAIAAGELSQALLDEIKTAGGMYGEQMAKLAQEQFAVAQGLEAVKKAEDELTAAKARASAAGVKVNKGLMEYNQMLRSGASKDALNAKLAELNAAKAEQQTAEEGIVTAEDNVTKSKEALEAMREQAVLTERILQNMIELNQAQIDAAKAAKEAADAAKAAAPGAPGGGAAVPELPEMGGAGGGGFDPNAIVNPMRDAVNKAAEAMKEKLRAKWEEIKNIVKQKWDEAMARIKAAWDELMQNPVFAKIVSNIQEAWAGLQQLWEDIKHIWSHVIKGEWSEAWDAILVLMSDWWENLKTSVGNAMELVKLIISERIDKIKEDWAVKWEEIKAKAAEIWAGIQEKVTVVFSAIKAWLEEKLDALFSAMGLDLDDMKARWSAIWEDVRAIAEEIWNRIKEAILPKFEEIKSTIQTIIENIQTTWNSIWDSISTKVSEIWTGIVTAVSGPLTELYNSVTGKIQEIWDKLTGWVGSFTQWGRDIIQGITNGVLEAAGGLVSAATTAVQNALTAVKKLLKMKSPSEVFADIGMMTMKGMEIGIASGAVLPQKAMTNAVARTTAPALVPITMGATNYYQPSITMNNTINNGMSVPALESMIMRTVRKGMTA